VELSKRFVAPRPKHKAFHLLTVCRSLLHLLFDGCLLRFSRPVGFPFHPAVQGCSHALHRIELWQIRQLLNALDRNLRICVLIIPWCAIPDHCRGPAFPLPPERRRQDSGSDVLTPRSPHHAAHPVQRNHHLPQCALPFHVLHDLHPAQRPCLGALPTQVDVYVVTLIHVCGARPDHC
jgi:hypothetical protein